MQHTLSESQAREQAAQRELAEAIENICKKYHVRFDAGFAPIVSYLMGKILEEKAVITLTALPIPEEPQEPVTTKPKG